MMYAAPIPVLCRRLVVYVPRTHTAHTCVCWKPVRCFSFVGVSWHRTYACTKIIPSEAGKRVGERLIHKQVNLLPFVYNVPDKSGKKVSTKQFFLILRTSEKLNFFHIKFRKEVFLWGTCCLIVNYRTNFNFYSNKSLIFPLKINKSILLIFCLPLKY